MIDLKINGPNMAKSQSKKKPVGSFFLTVDLARDVFFGAFRCGESREHNEKI